MPEHAYGLFTIQINVLIATSNWLDKHEKYKYKCTTHKISSSLDSE